MNKNNQELALFKFSLIAPVVNNTYIAVSKMQYFRDVAAKTHVLPNGKNVKFAASTVKSWFLNYNKGGFDSLLTKTRSDLGVPRAINDDAIIKIHDIKKEFPYITGKLIHQKLVEDGYIKASRTSLASIYRYLKENNLKRTQMSPVERKAFEMEFANDCWQSDTSRGPMIKVDNYNKRQTYLITMIDDASRIITHGEFFFNDNAVNVQLVFKKAISKYGIPKKLFVDNGAPFKNDQLRMICASLGIVLIHAKPYSPESKAKIERSFRTIKDNWLNAIDWNLFDSLESLNIAFNKYLNEKYQNVVHSSLGITPRERYLKDTDKIKFLKTEDIEKYFLHRVVRKVNKDATIPLYGKLFEVPQKYISQKINIRYSPTNLDIAYVYNSKNISTETIYPLNKIENSKIKRKGINYTKNAGGGDTNV